MRFFIGPVVAVVVIPAFVCWVLWFAPTISPFMTPLTASSSALYSSLAIYVVFVGMAVITLASGRRQVLRERRLVVFLRSHIEAHAEGSWHYVPDAEDTVDSGVFGSKKDEAYARQRTSTGRIISLLHADARFFRFEPVHLAMRTEVQTLSTSSARIASYQNLAIRAGIFGTFVGLIMSLGRVQDVFLLRGTELANSNAASLASELNSIRDKISGLMGEVVQGLAVAFGTSISGLLAAFVIYFLASQGRDGERRLANEIHSACQRVQKLFRDHTNQNAELVRTAEALRGVMKENLSALSSVSKSLDVNTARLVETSATLGTGLSEPVQLFANNATALKQLLEQSAAAAAVAREVSASLAAAEQGSVKRMEAIAADLAGLSERSVRQISAALEANSVTVTEAGKVVAGSVTEAMRTMSGELMSGLGQIVGAEYRQEMLSGLLSELEKLHQAHETSIRQIRREGRRQTRNTLVVTIAILFAGAGIAYAVSGDGMAVLLSKAKAGFGFFAPVTPEGDTGVR